MKGELATFPCDLLCAILLLMQADAALDPKFTTFDTSEDLWLGEFPTQAD